MTESKYQKYLDKTADIDSGLGVCRKRPIILSDSKGCYLRRNVANLIENNIVWRCRGGLNTKEGIDWFLGDYQTLSRRYTSISLYVWLGTCDLTHKQSKYISLKDSYNTDAADLTQCYRNLSRRANELNFTVTFLEIPYYSIVEWNRSKGHKHPENFGDQDKTLQEAIQNINENIRSINEENGVYSPRFNIDLARIRKNKRRNPKFKVNFNHYLDGVHGGDLLCKLWLRKISEIIKKDCY